MANRHVEKAMEALQPLVERFLDWADSWLARLSDWIEKDPPPLPPRRRD